MNKWEANITLVEGKYVTFTGISDEGKLEVENWHRGLENTSPVINLNAGNQLVQIHNSKVISIVWSKQ